MTDEPYTPRKVHDPKYALVLMEQGTDQIAGLVQRALLEMQGLEHVDVLIGASIPQAVNYINTHRVEITIAGKGYGDVVRYIEGNENRRREDTRPSARKGIWTLAVTTNGVPADETAPSYKGLTDMVQRQNLIRDLYRENMDAQKRMNLDDME